MFFKATADLEQGTVYIIKMVLDCGTTVYKIGITTRAVEDRLAELVIDMFKKIRYIPRTSLKRFSKSSNYRHVELELLEMFKEHKYEWYRTFGGCNEFICGVEEELLLEEYDKRMKV